MSDEMRAALAGLVLNKSPWVTGHNNKARCWHCGGWQDRGGHAADCPWEAARHVLSASAPATEAGERGRELVGILSDIARITREGLKAGFYSDPLFEIRARLEQADAREAGRERVIGNNRINGNPEYRIAQLEAALSGIAEECEARSHEGRVWNFLGRIARKVLDGDADARPETGEPAAPRSGDGREGE